MSGFKKPTKKADNVEENGRGRVLGRGREVGSGWETGHRCHCCQCYHCYQRALAERRCVMRLSRLITVIADNDVTSGAATQPPVEVPWIGFVRIFLSFRYTERIS